MIIFLQSRRSRWFPSRGMSSTRWSERYLKNAGVDGQPLGCAAREHLAHAHDTRLAVAVVATANGCPLRSHAGRRCRATGRGVHGKAHRRRGRRAREGDDAALGRRRAGACHLARRGAARVSPHSQRARLADLGIDINVKILEKALGLELRYFEDSDFYDKLTRARREASSRPIALVTESFGLVQSVITLVGYAVLLVRFSGWAVLALAVATVPATIAEMRYSKLHLQDPQLALA